MKILIVVVYLVAFVFYFLFSLYITRLTAFRKDFLNPLFVFVLYFSLTYFALPAFQIKDSKFRYMISYSEDAYILSFLYFNSFLLIVIFTYLIGTKYLKVKKNISVNILDIKNWGRTERYILVFLRVFVLIPCLFIIMYFYQFIYSIGYETYLANRIILLSGKGYYITFLLMLIPYVIFEIAHLLYSTFIKGFKLRYLIFFGFLIFVSIIPGVILGSRTNLVLPLLLVTLSYMHLKNAGRFSLGKKTIALLIIVSSILFIAFWLEGIRQSIMSGNNMDGSSDLLIQIAGGFGTAENFFWWIDYTDSKYFFGSTILTVFVGFIPRSVWVNKPFGGGPVFKNTMFPGSYDQSGENISSLTTGFPFEFLMNFGFIGAFIGGVIFGLLLLLVFYLKHKIDNPLTYSLWFMLLYSVTMYLHSEVFGATAKLLAFLFPLVVVNVLSKLSRRKQINEKRSQIKHSYYSSNS